MCNGCISGSHARVIVGFILCWGNRRLLVDRTTPLKLRKMDAGRVLNEVCLMLLHELTLSSFGQGLFEKLLLIQRCTEMDRPTVASLVFSTRSLDNILVVASFNSSGSRPALQVVLLLLRDCVVMHNTLVVMITVLLVFGHYFLNFLEWLCANRLR